jgi:hypothetical protein
MHPSRSALLTVSMQNYTMVASSLTVERELAKAYKWMIEKLGI